MRLLTRVAVAVALLALGAGTAVASVAVHELGWALPLAVAATLLTLVALPAGWWTRLPFALGWTCLVAWVVGPRPEGDYVISSDVQGYVVVGLALLVLVLGIATLPRPGGRAREPDATGTAGERESAGIRS
ncbi:hypothetical protein [Nocardioides panaciterrulae]|uniref:SPW repeat-containing protein n=1 Tax=Nocardioides panaciterrulae TaxID=661492 RepID=A0A7Y9JC36_9ACTN|nr:hypothetical protein [Nocardioides panaciterrulae]NYD42831.1 hypothetical protein [Nocardioides panaciterrulae]